MKNSQSMTKNSQLYTEDWIPIKAISNGTILLNNKQKVTGVKIKPRNIFILDQGSQDNALISLKNFYNTIDFEFWMIIADRPVDINLYLAQLQVLYNKTTNNIVRKLIMHTSFFLPLIILPFYSFLSCNQILSIILNFALLLLEFSSNSF